MFERSKANKELKKLYEAWYQEVKGFKMLNSDSYTNPCYVGIPDNWFKSKHRILIVGEETFGENGYGKECGLKPCDIEKIQNYNLNIFKRSMTPTDRLENPFWDRARRVASLGWPCAWTFLDKVGRKWDRRSRLDDTDRNLLHSVQTRVLAHEIRILKPTVIFFFGWIGTALKTELPEMHRNLYPGGDNDDSLWKNNFVYSCHNNMMLLFTYSPYSPNWRKKPATYEDDIISCVANYTNVKRIKYDPPVADKQNNYSEYNDNDEDDTEYIVDNSRSKSAGNVALGVVASYALGKAATKAMDDAGIGIAKSNPNTERYMAAHKSARESGNLSQRAKSNNKQRVKLSNGRGAYLYTMPNGDQQLTDLNGRRIANYDASSNKTSEGIKVIGKGNLISTFLS